MVEHRDSSCLLIENCLREKENGRRWRHTAMFLHERECAHLCLSRGIPFPFSSLPACNVRGRRGKKCGRSKLYVTEMVVICAVNSRGTK